MYGFLSPEFNKNTTEYDLIVDLSVDNIEIDAKAEDEKADIYISGNKDLQEGENTIYIVVTAENGTKKTYKINVTKTDDIEHINANLKELNVKNYNLYPSFKPSIYNYSLNITEKIDKLEIIAEAENENAQIKIEGNEKLKEGENIIKVIVTAEDGQTSREYKINVFLSTKDVNKKEQNILEPIIILGILLATACGVVILLINKK